jgi:hypothetical protein
MDAAAQTPLETWHFFLYLALLAALGTVGHVMRAVINPIPDRLSDSDAMDMILSDGYDMEDKVFGTEYDDYGYYRLDSWRNLQLAVVTAMIGGAVAYLITDKELAHAFAWAANISVAWLWDLIVYRLTGQ